MKAKLCAWFWMVSVGNTDVQLDVWVLVWRVTAILLNNPKVYQNFLMAKFPSINFRMRWGPVWLISLHRNAPQFGQNALKNAPQKNLAKMCSKMRHRNFFIAFLCINFFRRQIFLKKDLVHKETIFEFCF